MTGPASRRVTRRDVLSWAVASAGVAGLLRPGRADAGRLQGDRSPGTRLILLGTGGGPSPKPDRSAPANAVVVGDAVYVVDCGDGVARQYVRAGLRFPDLAGVFVTHQHSDHNADFGNLFLLGWTTGLSQPVPAYGPPPLAAMARQFAEMQKYDIETRIADEGRPSFTPIIKASEITAGGVVHQDARVKVTAALNRHPPVTPSFAYRFDTADRSIVISGDTNVSDEVIALAKGADVLVHEVLYVPGIDRIMGSDSNARRLREHIVDSHTSTEDVGKVAARAGVKTLVLSHFVPGADPTITDAMWLEGVRKHFAGEVVLGRDLQVI
jgi:ribonuclease BN (tRNA processing enzyme)